jgi:hypothetical protein
VAGIVEGTEFQIQLWQTGEVKNLGGVARKSAIGAKKWIVLLCCDPHLLDNDLCVLRSSEKQILGITRTVV